MIRVVGFRGRQGARARQTHVERHRARSFAYFLTSIALNPAHQADITRKHRGVHSGNRAGPKTERYLATELNASRCPARCP